MSKKSDTPYTSKEDAEPAVKKQRADKTRQTRSKFQPHGSTATRSRSNSMAVLPSICPICKKSELTYTCPISRKSKLLFYNIV